MEEEEIQQESKIAKMSKTLGGNLSREKKNALYFGHAPKGSYPTDSSLEDIHSFGMSNNHIRKLYGLSPKEGTAIGATRSDTKETLIKELVEQSSLRRREAEEVVNSLIAKGVLKEVKDKELGKVLTFRGV